MTYKNVTSNNLLHWVPYKPKTTCFGEMRRNLLIFFDLKHPLTRDSNLSRFAGVSAVGACRRNPESAFAIATARQPSLLEWLAEPKPNKLAKAGGRPGTRTPDLLRVKQAL